jgi:hypothetical protein
MLPRERAVLHLWLRMGAVNGDAKRSEFQAASGLSIRRFPRSLYAYRKLLWPAPVVRRCFLEDRHVWRLGQFGWRCEFHLIECTLEPINMALSAKLLNV